MALLLLARDYSKNLVALTVDHGLRRESRDEAQQVKLWCEKLGVHHHILRIQDSEFRIQGKIQETARNARYQLLTDWCKKNNIHHLLTAHHRGDQAETLFFRLARGSGLRGLAGILPISNMHGMTIVRPLLSISKKALITYLQEKNQRWIEDPSNQKMDFTRNSIRAQLSVLPNQEQIERRAGEVCDFFQRMRSIVDKLVEKAKNEVVNQYLDSVIIDQKKFIDLPSEIGLQLLATLICELSGDNHPPRSEKLHRLYRWFFALVPAKSSLAGLTFNYNKPGDKVHISPATRP